jgi:hypothetical protein
LTILLNEGRPQTRKTVALERAPPREELFLGELITVQGFFHRDPAGAHRRDHRSFTMDHPSPGIRGRQIVHLRHLRWRFLDRSIDDYLTC